MAIEISLFVLSIIWVSLGGSVLFSKATLEELSASLKMDKYSRITIGVNILMSVVYGVLLCLWQSQELTHLVITIIVSFVLVALELIDTYSFYIRSTRSISEIKHMNLLRIHYKLNGICYVVCSVSVMLLILYSWFK